MQFRKRNKRGFPLIRLVGVAGVCFFIVKYTFKDRSHSCTSQHQQTTIQHAVLCSGNFPTVNNDNPVKKTLQYIVRPGDSFYSIFKQFEIYPAIFNDVVVSLKKLDFHTLYPRDSVIIHKNSADSIFAIDFYSGLDNKYSVDCSGPCVKVIKEKLPSSIYTYLLKGKLENSLSESMFAMGVSDVITANIAAIFAWDINFFIDPRRGDRFQVIFEKSMIHGKSFGYGDIIAAKYTVGSNKTFYAYGIKGLNGKKVYYDCEGTSLQKQFRKAPLHYSRISSSYSHKRKHPILGIVRPHLGVDYAAPTGTPIYAAADGKVIFIGNKGGFGKLVIIAHGGAYRTYYGHLHSFSKDIYSGKWIQQGTFIGRVGMTGMATGPHLDYRIMKNGAFINPVEIVSPSVEQIQEKNLLEFQLIKEKCDMLFANRFNGSNGCFLLDIQDQRYKLTEYSVVNGVQTPKNPEVVYESNKP